MEKSSIMNYIVLDKEEVMNNDETKMTVGALH